jgi:alkylated DNA repair dioxygenase AlkB
MAQWQGSLLAQGEPDVDPTAPTERIELDDGAWIDVVRGFLGGADDLCAALIATVAWTQQRRRMFDRVLDDPRLSRWFAAEAEPPHPVLLTVRSELTRRYDRPFGGPGLNYYRDGRDSVASHADRELRDLDDALVAVLTSGARRPFLVRPKGGGRSVDLAPASGDLLVMGGACQARWEHGVPKVAQAGARVSVSWRWSAGSGSPSPPPPGGPGTGQSTRRTWTDTA